MFILFESNTSNEDWASLLINNDIMGIVFSEKEAMDWRDKNPEYRSYKYARLPKCFVGFVPTTGDTIEVTKTNEGYSLVNAIRVED